MSLSTGLNLPFRDWLYTRFQYSWMSLTDSNASLSIGPLSVFSTVPVVAGAFGRGPLGPSAAGKSPTRNGSLSVDNARPSTKVVHPASTSTAPAQAITARIPAIAPRRPWLFMANLIPTGLRGSIEGNPV